MQCFKCATPLPDGSRFCNSCGADVSGASGEQTLAIDVDPELQAKLQAELGQDFVVVRELGRGGMAIVYEARDAHLGRKVAIKILPPELTFGRGLVERFKREARTAATLDHPHIIPIFRVSTGGKLFWFVMKYLEGESLAEHVKREGAQPYDITVDVIEQVADALQYAHDHGVIHRDVKPANVMLDQRGWVTVTDFGIAKAASEQSMTGSGSMIGTPYYMSPEQCTGKKVTGAADQYSLGIMAYEMLSGQLPFTGDSAFDIIKQHCMDPVPPLSEVSPRVPSAIVAVVERALSKAPAARFPSVLDFAVALREAWGESTAPPGTHAEHKAVTARPARHGLSPSTPRTPRPSVTVDVNALPPVPTEVLTPEEPQQPAPKLEPQVLATPEPEREEAKPPEPAPQELATQALELEPQQSVPPALELAAATPPEPEEAKPPEPAPAAAKPLEPEPEELKPPEPEALEPPVIASPEPEALKPTVVVPQEPVEPKPPEPAPEPEREEPRRPAPRPMAPARPRPAPFALTVEKRQERKLVTPVAIVAMIALAAGLFGAWKLISARGAPSAPANLPAAQIDAESLSAVTTQVDSPAPAATPTSAPAAASPARLVLRGTPSGALISRDGQRVRGTAMDLEPRRRHIVAVQAAGFEPWADTLIPREGQRINRAVSLRRLAEPAATPATGQPAGAQQPPRQAAAQPQARQQAVQPAGPVATQERAPQRAEPQAAPARQPAEQPTQRQPAPPTSEPANRTAAAPTGVAYISVGSLPQSSIYINGRPVPFNPVQDFRVPAGEVRVRFTVTDGAGTWSYDTTVTVAVGEHRNLLRIALARRP